MTAQQLFHYFASRAGDLALLPIHLVALVHHGDFLAEIVGVISVTPGLDGMDLDRHDDRSTPWTEGG